jgi:hypothetical protein
MLGPHFMNSDFAQHRTDFNLMGSALGARGLRVTRRHSISVRSVSGTLILPISAEPAVFGRPISKRGLEPARLLTGPPWGGVP